MKNHVIRAVAAAIGFGLLSAEAQTTALTAPQIIANVLQEDPFGLGGAAITARFVLKDKSGALEQLAFTGRSWRHDPPFSKSIIRFTAPPDLAGAGFLQIQNRSGDDDRFLFLPELKRSRRIAGSLRASSFMGTDFSFADLDQRDLREGDAVARPDENVGKYVCYRIDVFTRRTDSPYSKLEAFFRKDNLLPLKLLMYDRTQRLTKVFMAQEVRRVDGQWFVTKSRMTDLPRGHVTDLVLDKVAPIKNGAADEFTVRNLEKL